MDAEQLPTPDAALCLLQELKFLLHERIGAHDPLYDKESFIEHGQENIPGVEAVGLSLERIGCPTCKVRHTPRAVRGGTHAANFNVGRNPTRAANTNSMSALKSRQAPFISADTRG